MAIAAGTREGNRGRSQKKSPAAAKAKALSMVVAGTTNHKMNASVLREPAPAPIKSQKYSRPMEAAPPASTIATTNPLRKKGTNTDR